MRQSQKAPSTQAEAGPDQASEGTARVEQAGLQF